MGKVVQTVLDESEYEHLKKVARRKGMRIKEAARSAILSWTRESEPLDLNDPFFQLKPVDLGDPELSSKVDEILYGRRMRH
ncbi:MAG: hypothetical protein QW828_04860 [Candidatus Bathyarchaeia archaeon]